MKTPLHFAAAAVIAAALLLPAPARADQLEWLTPAQAEQAQVVVAGVGVIRHFCKPCGDESSRPEHVDTAEIMAIEDGDGHWNLLVNGEPVDLAYVYVPVDGAWRNLGALLKLEPSDVPAKLDRALLELGEH